MTRRSFLKLLGIGAGAAAAGSSLLSVAKPVAHLDPAHPGPSRLNTWRWCRDRAFHFDKELDYLHSAKIQLIASHYKRIWYERYRKEYYAISNPA
jgi:hypothetical protein